jgi:hypothetical protein
VYNETGGGQTLHPNQPPKRLRPVLYVVCMYNNINGSITDCILFVPAGQARKWYTESLRRHIYK